MPPYRILMSPEAGADGVAPAVDDWAAGHTAEASSGPRADHDAPRARGGDGPSQGRRVDPEALLQAREAAHARELAALEQKVSELEKSYRSALRDRELATALAGRPLVAG